MKGNEYRDLIASYILKNFGDRGLTIYTEVNVGTSIIGKGRRIDIFVLSEEENRAFAIECKFQGTSGTVDEKIPYALQDINAMHMPGCIAYAGDGFSKGVLHLLESSEVAAYCLPDPSNLKRDMQTIEIDHMLALCFKWWDLLVQNKNKFICQ